MPPYIATQPLARAYLRGFTIIEIMIVVAIIGILASVAYPSYAKHVQKTKRIDGTMALLKESQALERCRSTRYSYANCSVENASSTEGLYTITLENTASNYTITATAQGSQEKDTECKVLTLNQLGVRTPSPETSSCWAD